MCYQITSGSCATLINKRTSDVNMYSTTHSVKLCTNSDAARIEMTAVINKHIMLRLFIISAIGLFFSSCATLIHQRSADVNVHSDTDSVKICINNDTTRWYNTPTWINVVRSRNDLLITAKKDHVQKLIQINSRLSTAFWLGNMFSGIGILGYAIDLTNPKRFTYPSYVTLNFTGPNQSSTRQYKTWIESDKNPLSFKSQNKKFAIKLSPLSLIDEFTFPTIQGGLEIKLSNRITWYNEVGIKYRQSSFEVSDTSFLKSYGFKVKTEIRYYLPGIFGLENTNNSMSGYYVGGNIFYNRDCHNTKIEYYLKKDSTNLLVDNFAVKKDVFGANLVLGLQEPIWNNLLLDLYTGLGIRFRNISNSHREYDPGKDYTIGPIDFNYRAMRDNIDMLEGFSSTFNLTLGFRLCYRF